MLYLVYGGSGSGKSAFAESLCVSRFHNEDSMYYLATMENCDGECNSKILRHREMRKEKHFITLEQARDIHMSHFGPEEIPQRVVLLECLTTLLTNEIYTNGHYEDVSNKVKHNLLALKDQCRDLIIVSSDVFRSGERYDSETEGYIQQLGYLHQMISQSADCVYEVVAGIPICVKGENSYAEQSVDCTVHI